MKNKKIILSSIVAALAILAYVFFVSTSLLKNNKPPIDAEPTSSKNNDIKVSIVVPVYKTEKYINECVESLVNQTLKEIEIILVDDGSPDNCGKILDNWAKKDNRIKVIHQKNKGVSAARNAGINSANGEYIQLVDSDDTIDLDTCKISYEKAKAEDADILLHSIGREETLQTPVFILPTSSSCFAIYRLDFINKHGLRFIEGIRCCEDQGFNLLAFTKANKIVIIKNELYHYRRDNLDSCCHNPHVNEDYKCFGKVANVVYNDWKNSGFFEKDEVKVAFLRWFCCMNYWTISDDVSKFLVSCVGKELFEPEILRLLDNDTKKAITSMLKRAKK